MKRGDIVIAAQSGALTSKPRPYVVVQTDDALGDYPTVTMCVITTRLTGRTLIRVPVGPAATTGLVEQSEVATDKIVTLRRSAIRQVVGVLPDDAMRAVDWALRRWLDL